MSNNINPNSIFALIHDMNCADPDEMIIPELAERVRYLKRTKEGQQEVITRLSQHIDEAVEETSREIAVRLIALGKLTPEEIADCVNLPLSTVHDLASETKR